MSLLTVVQDVCAVVGVNRPASVFANILNTRTMQEMLALANEMAQRIAYDNREWNKLKKSATLTGDDIKEAFDLPADFKRMLKTAQVWRSTNALQPMAFYPDTDEYLQRRILNYQQAFGEWTIYGGQMHIWPIMGTGVTARFAYLDKNCIYVGAAPVAGPLAPTPPPVKDVFMADDDTFRLAERLLKLGMIWQWKANKGSPYAEDLSNYETALAVETGADSPSPIIIDRLPISRSARVAYPWPVPT